MFKHYEWHHEVEFERRNLTFAGRNEYLIAGNNKHDLKESAELLKDPSLKPKPDFMSVEFEEFLNRVKANDWVYVLSRLRSNKAYGLNPDMQEHKPMLEMPSFKKNRLEKRNGTDFLNARDDLDRCALEIAFEFKAYDVAGTESIV